MKALFTHGFAAIVWACRATAIHALGLLAPAGTPRHIIAKLNAETVRAMNAPDVKDRMAAQGLFVVAGTAEEFVTYLKAEIAKWATVVKDSGAKAD